MDKKVKFSSFIPTILICALLNLILFVTVPHERLETGVFWLGWAFAFPVNVIIAVTVWIYIHRQGGGCKENLIVYLPLTVRVLMAATIAYLVLGAILMYAPITSTTVPVVLECVLTGIYGMALYFALFGMNRIAGAQKETKKKVLFIRLLQSDLESCFYQVTDPALLLRLQQLSEKIRFSDPMSDESLESCEKDLTMAVLAITTKVNGGDVTGIDADIAKVEGLLQFRNSRCLLLK